MISLEGSWKTSNDLLPLMQSVNKFELFTVGLHYPSRGLFPSPNSFLQHQPISPRAATPSLSESLLLDLIPRG